MPRHRRSQVDTTGRLDAESAFSALAVFASAPTCTAVVVMEFNAELAPDGSHAAGLVEGLVKVLGA